MDVAIAMFPTDLAIGPAQLAVEVERRGFHGLWFPEHTHIPVDHTPFPAGGDLPDHYRRIHDPFVALTAAAAATTGLRLGTGVCLVAQHDPIVLAKQIASLDQLSGGRFDFGVGYGWNRPELEHHGVRFEDRRAVVRESVLAMRRLWTEESAAFAGEHVRFDASWSWPKPVQDPHPPVYLGAGYGPRTEAALVEFCDGWMPIGASGLDETVPRLRSELEAAGRDPDAFTVVVHGTRPDADRFRRLAAAGVDRVTLWVRPQQAAGVVAELDQHASLIEAA